MIKDDENYYNQTNFVRDDWGGQVRTPQSGKPSEDQSANFFNGNDSKPFPNDRNFVLNPDALVDNIGQGHNNTILGHEPGKEYAGQAKYAVRGLGPSIYQDKSRYTADDTAAAKVSDNGKPAPDNFPVSMEETQEGFGR